MALFLTVAGLTGSVLAFYHEIDHWLNPELSFVAVQDKAMLDGLTLRERAEQLAPHARVDIVGLKQKPGDVYTAWLSPRTNPATGEPYALDYDTVRLNPYTGELIEQRKSDGFWPLTRYNILPFLYSLHYSLALGDIGIWLFGIAALVWTFDCFVGFYLTLPAHLLNDHKDGVPEPNARSQLRRGFWSRWSVAWKVKWRGSFHRINFDLHRAGGLWTWILLLVFAWSSVAFNLNDQVYTPVMRALFGLPNLMELPRANLPEPRPEPGLGWSKALEVGREHMAALAVSQGLTIRKEEFLTYDPGKGAFGFTVQSDRDVSENSGATTVFLDSVTGEKIGELLPTGENSGITITVWLSTLHMAGIWGLPYKVAVCLLGMVIAMLSLTGVYLWWKKRQAARRTRLAKRANLSERPSLPEAPYPSDLPE